MNEPDEVIKDYILDVTEERWRLEDRIKELEALREKFRKEDEEVDETE